MELVSKYTGVILRHSHLMTQSSYGTIILWHSHLRTYSI